MSIEIFCTVFTKEDQNRIPEPEGRPVKTIPVPVLRNSWITMEKVLEGVQQKMVKNVPVSGLRGRT